MYELITFFTAVISAFVAGSFVMTLKSLGDARTSLVKASENMDNKVKEFHEIIRQSSEANNSMGTMLSDMGDKLVMIDERVSMLSGAATVTGAGVNTWPNQKQRK